MNPLVAFAGLQIGQGLLSRESARRQAGLAKQISQMNTVFQIQDVQRQQQDIVASGAEARFLMARNALKSRAALQAAQSAQGVTGKTPENIMRASFFGENYGKAVLERNVQGQVSARQDAIRGLMIRNQQQASLAQSRVPSLWEVGLNVASNVGAQYMMANMFQPSIPSINQSSLGQISGY